jgi:signal transduction histidine kinase
MNRILLLIDHKENARLLAEWLKKRYPLSLADSEEGLRGPFDLGIVDGPALNRLSKAIRSRKESERPRFLPFILAVSRPDAALFKEHLWKSVDELLAAPIDKMELQARVEVLLRARGFSSELKIRNDDLEAYAQALMHDLRAPVRAIGSFSKLMIQEQKEKLDARGKHHLDRIHTVAEQAWDLIDALLNFSRLGRKEIALRNTPLSSLAASCLRNLEEEIAAAGAEITIGEALPSVVADPALLRTAVTNLLSNAIKYVPPGTRPRVTLSAAVRGGSCRIQVEDNGIGISPEDQARIFTPFVRLHGVEEYPGIGLGLSTVRKAVEMMGGRLGVESSPGKGSRFWIDLPASERKGEKH